MLLHIIWHSKDCCTGRLVFKREGEHFAPLYFFKENYMATRKHRKKVKALRESKPAPKKRTTKKEKKVEE